MTDDVRPVGRDDGQVPGGAPVRPCPRPGLAPQLAQRERRRRQDDTGDQGRRAKEEAQDRPPGADRRTVRPRARPLHPRAPGTSSGMRMPRAGKIDGSGRGRAYAWRDSGPH